MTQRCFLFIVMAIAALSLTGAACSVADDDMGDASFNNAVPTILAEYEGEWTVNRQVVDTARMVVGKSLNLRLPEAYLLGLCAPMLADAGGHAPTTVPQGVPTEIYLQNQGYSEQAQYLTFAQAAYQSGGQGALHYIACSFAAAIDGTPYRVGLVTTESANAVMQNDGGQWTLGIPLTALLLTNIATGETTLCELSVTTHLYYTTKRRTV